MKVTLKTVKSESFVIESEPSCTVGEMKARIEADRGPSYPKESLLLIFQGKLLSDDVTLEAAGVEEGKFLVVMSRKPSKPKEPVAAPAPTASPAAATEATAEPEAAKGPEPPKDESKADEETGGSTEEQEPAAEQQQQPEASGSGNPYAAAAGTLATGAELDKSIEQIVEMGFEVEQVKAAMRAAFNNPERAVEYLMTGIPQHARMPAPQAPPAAAVGQAAAEATLAAPPVQQPGGVQAPQAPAEQAAAGGGLNAQPLDLFGGTTGGQAGGGAAAAAGGAVAAGGGAAGGDTNLDFLRNDPQFNALRQMVQEQPHLLQAMLQELGRSQPQLLQLIQSNQAAFLRLMNEPVEGDPAAALVGGGGQEPMQVELQEGDEEAITRLEGLGFPREMCIEAWIACDRNEELAANYLMDAALGD